MLLNVFSELCDDAKNAVSNNKAFLSQQANKMKKK